MQFDLSTPTRSFVYIQYANNATASLGGNHMNQNRQLTKTINHRTSVACQSNSQSPSIKRRRQQAGYACDKCRERRVGCDRIKPGCGQCQEKYKCVYSNHTLRLDNVSMRHRMEEMQSKIRQLTDTLSRLENDYHHTVPEFVRGQLIASAAAEYTSGIPEEGPVAQDCEEDSKMNNNIIEWAEAVGWAVTENQRGGHTFQTNITKIEELLDTVRYAVKISYDATNPSIMYSQPSILHDPPMDTGPRAALQVGQSHLSFSVFESLKRIQPVNKLAMDADMTVMDMNALEMDVMTRLIHKHHQCSFPILVSPARFERHYKQGELQPLVLSSIFGHAVPHTSIYHRQLVKIKEARELGQRFYNHSRAELSLDETPSLSNIHQRTLLITYDLDLGRVRRAFLHLGIAIRMCFALNLHCPEGYVHCKNQFEREQAKRIFWAVWFFDSMVPHFFAQPSSILSQDVSIDVPTVLCEFDQLEMDQTRFSISIIRIRQIASELDNVRRKNSMPVEEIVHRFAARLRVFYRRLAPQLRFTFASRLSAATSTTFSRRTFFCVLLDYCQCWVSLYRMVFQDDHLSLTNEAIRRTSQAAMAMVTLFEYWFRISSQSSDGFDCFFRPYLYHFMSAIQIFKANITQGDRSSSLVQDSKILLVKMLSMYRTTPTYHSFDESQLEKDLVAFLLDHHISPDDTSEPSITSTNLVDDSSAECGWGIFSMSTRDPKWQETGSMAASVSSGNTTSSTSASDIDEMAMDYF